MWKTGDRLTHRENPGLGPGRVASVSGRHMEVEFPSTGARLRLAADSPALALLELRPGQRVRRHPSGLEARLGEIRGGRALLSDGTEAALDDLWPVDETDLVERLAAGDLDRVEDFALRLDALHLARLREAEGLGSFLGGRIRLFPHQLHVAERATRQETVRWLLADEVGLGKTVEACLVLDHLIRTGRIERCLVVAPSTLTVQWLGELWRKYQQVFVLLDEDRLKDVAKDYGRGFNPFDAHRRVVVSLEMMAAEPRLTRWAVEAGIDLLVVDEAHHLRRPRGHAGDAAYRAVEPIARQGRHVLLLTATPLEDDTHGFFRLLQLLRPDEFARRQGAHQPPLQQVLLASLTGGAQCVASSGRGLVVQQPLQGVERGMERGAGRPVDLAGGHQVAGAVEAVRGERLGVALWSGEVAAHGVGPSCAQLAGLAGRDGRLGAGLEDPHLVQRGQRMPDGESAGLRRVVERGHRAEALAHAEEACDPDPPGLEGREELLGDRRSAQHDPAGRRERGVELGVVAHARGDPRL